MRVRNDPQPSASSSRSAIPTIFVSGAVAGVVSRTATAPLDRVKVLQQVGVGVQGVRCLYREGGWLSLFRGNSANALKSIPEVGIKFSAFDAVSRWQHRGSAAKPTVRERLASGALAGAASCIAVYPLEVAKTRMAIQGEYMGVVDCIASIVRHEGLVALTHGLRASLLGIVPFCALDLAIYSASKENIAKWQGRDEPTSVALFVCGAGSSAVAQLVTYPLAVIRTLLQASGMPGQPRYTSTIDCAVQTMQRGGGVRALYRGLRPNMLKAVPSIAVSYVIFEKMKRLLGP